MCVNCFEFLLRREFGGENRENTREKYLLSQLRIKSDVMVVCKQTVTLIFIYFDASISYKNRTKNQMYFVC